MIINLWRMFPRKIAKKNHDYVGLMHKGLKKETKKIVLCLDCTGFAIEEAIKINADLIISHHPFIYGTIGKVLRSDPLKRKLFERLDEVNIPVYSFHTNFDEGDEGMNDALMEKLELLNIRKGVTEPCLRIGELKEAMEVHEFARYVKEKLDLPYGLLINEGKKYIKSVGIIGGGGSRYYAEAINEGVDIYISGDAPHHIRRDIVDHHFNYLDLVHEIEKIFMSQMKKILLRMDPTLEIICVDDQKLPELI